MNTRYTIGMNRRTGRRATTVPYTGFITSVVISVPVNSHGNPEVPAATPASSRTARKMK